MDSFIERIILGRTIQAAFQRGNVYAEAVPRKDRISLKESIEEELRGIAQGYTNNVSENNHLNNIKQLSKKITQKHKQSLKNGQLRIGTAQKLLNVYVKFLWCLGEAAEPIHCPVDRIVLRRIGDKRNWTDMNTIIQYKDVISKIREHIGSRSIAEWEWELWNRQA